LARGRLRPANYTPCDVCTPLVASSFDSLLRSTFFRAHSRLQLKADLLVQSVNVAELPRARYCSNAAVFPVELTVRTEARHHRRRRGPVGTTTDTGSARRPPTSSLVSRVPESGLRTVQSTRRRRPGDQRYEPGHLTSVVDHAVSTRQPTATSATATCSGGVNVVAPLLCCSARCFGDIYVLCSAFSVFPLLVTLC